MDQPHIALSNCLATMTVGSKRDGRGDPEFHTHVSMIQPRGKFQMNITKMEEFWSHYCDFAASGKTGVGVAEKSQEYLPVLVDFDIKLVDTFTSYPLYARDQIKRVVKIYTDVIKAITRIDDKDIVCFVLEKPHYFLEINGTKYVKNGFHLHFPNVFLDKKDHQVFLMPHVTDRLQTENIFANIGVEDSSLLVDKQYCTVPWLMYGSHKPEGLPYKLSFILDANLHEISLEDAAAQCPVYSVDEDRINVAGKEIYYLPRILSIIPFHRKIYTIRSNISSPVKETFRKVNTMNQTLTDQEIMKNLEQARAIIPMISYHRAESRSDWMTVGWVLFNIGQGSREALDLWLDFSKQCAEKYSESVCIYEWENMTVRNLTLGTLVYFAKNDNPELYAQHISSRLKNMDIKNTHADIAQQLYSMYGDEYVCASISNNLWFKYENHRWLEIDGGVYLRNKISSDIVEKVEDQLKEMERKAGGASGWEEKMYEAGTQALKRLVKDLKSHPFKVNVMKECCDLFFDSEFFQKLDANRYLFGFKNGVYDAKLKTLRPGLPEDYISKQSPIIFEEFSETHPKVLRVYELLSQIFVDKSIYKFFMDTTSEVFVGGNTRKICLFWSGVGGNGKSVLIRFIEAILGPYAIKFATTVITGARAQSNSCTPDLIRAGQGVRWAVVQEPTKKESINISVLKEMTGNDTFYARALYRPGVEVSPMFKLVVICNEPPRMPDIDQATINRICVIPFESVFNNDAPESLEEQIAQKKFPVDVKLIPDGVNELAQAFLWTLVHHQRTTTPSEIPEKVKLATSKYINRNDYLRQFMNETFVSDETAVLTIQDMYTAYKDWFKLNMANTSSILPRMELLDYLTGQWGEPVDSIWKGYRKIETGGFEDLTAGHHKPPI